MAAITRWTKYEIDAVGSAGTGDGEGCKGTRGYSAGRTAPAAGADKITIGPTTDRLHIAIDGEAASYITLYSGSELDPRFVARDITEKLHLLSGQTEEYWTHATCRWENTPADGNMLKIYSGSLGTGSSVTVTSGTNDARVALGLEPRDETGGSITGNTFNGTVSISGTSNGFFDEIYKIVISNDDVAGTRGIEDSPYTPDSGSYAGTLTTGGVYNSNEDTNYTITINTTNGSTMGAGTSNVPTMSWTDTGSDTASSTDTELLYPDYWYKVGTRGLMVKFTDAVFTSPVWTIDCKKPVHTSGSNANDPVGSAQYIWSSDRGDYSSSQITTVSGAYTRLGSRGLYVKFTGTNNLYARDEFYVIIAGPLPCDKGEEGSHYDITSLNYGNVTVSTESDVKCVMFEIESGAAQMSTVKFGLQSHGSFSHHDTGNSDTYFRLGTVGPGNNNGKGSPQDGKEWYPNIVAADIDSDVAPDYLYATEDNLPVVATADLSEAIGNYPICGLTSDPIWLNIRLGASETGANSSINYRLYFDYS